MNERRAKGCERCGLVVVLGEDLPRFSETGASAGLTASGWRLLCRRCFEAVGKARALEILLP